MSHDDTVSCVLATIHVATPELDDLEGVTTYAIFKVNADLYQYDRDSVKQAIIDAAQSHYGASRTCVSNMRKVRKHTSFERELPVLNIQLEGIG